MTRAEGPGGDGGRVALGDLSGVAPTRGLHLQLSERKLLLGLGDVLAMDVALALALLVGWRAIGYESPSALWFLVLGACWFLVAPALGCYDLKTASSRWGGVLASIRAGAVVVVLYFLIPYLSAPLLRSRAMMLTFGVSALALLCMWRFAYTAMVVQPQFRVRALILGAGWAGTTIAEAIAGYASSAYDLVGYVDDDPTKQGVSLKGLPVLGDGDHLREIVRDQDVQELIVAITRNMRAELHRSLLDAFESGLRVVPMQELYETVTSRIAVEHVGDRWFAAVPGVDSANLVYSLVRRGIDLFLGALGSLVLSVVFPFIAVAIKLDSPGPVLYAQDRVGRRGTTFRIVKFRSMVADAEKEGAPVWASERDPRVTRVGRFLRATRLDELPQFVNVLKGEMTLIGPRPERPAFVAQLERQIPFYRARLLVKPGLTGWAQVMYRYGNSAEDALTKLQYDLYYIKHQSPYLDLLIALKTIGVVLGRGGT